MAIQGMKKIIRKDPTERALLTRLKEISNCIFLFGKVGSSKTTTMLSLCQKYKEMLGYKWVYLWGGERSEHLYVGLPSRNFTYWNKVRKQFPGIKGDGAKQNKVHYIYFYWKGKFPKKLPNDLPNIKSSIVTIPFRSVTLENIMHAIGGLSYSDESTWSECIRQTNKDDGAARLEIVAEKETKQNQIIYKNFIKPLCKSGLFQSQTCSYNLDLFSELKDKDTITVFCFDFLQEEFKIFALEWLISQMYDILKKHSGMTRNIISVNEAAEFFRATDDAIAPDRYKVFRKSLSNYVRYGRIGLRFCFNCQSFAEVKGLVSGQDDYTLLFKMTSQADVEAATDHLRKVNLIRPDQIEQLYRLKPGQFFFCESGKPAILNYSFLPRTMFWEPGHGNFYEHIWKKYNDHWINTEPDITAINNLYSAEEEKIIAEEHEKAEKKRLKEQEAAAKRAEEKRLAEEERELKRLAARDKYIKLNQEKQQNKAPEEIKAAESKIHEQEPIKTFKTEQELIDNNNIKQEIKKEETVKVKKYKKPDLTDLY